jgi:DNA-binding transcriptional ArsR family regulator
MKRATDPDVLLLQAAADPTRLAILRQLSVDGGVCACDFTACCDVAQPTVSHHLKVLRESGWVMSERHGTSIWYSLCPDAVARFREIAGGILPGAARPAAMLGSLVTGGVGIDAAAASAPRSSSSSSVRSWR